jgi:VWFA-related protein
VIRTLLFPAFVLIAAQQPQAPKPSFSSNVVLVEVDVVVTDKSGRLVRDLRAEDFTIAEDGKGVSIASFSAVDIPPAPRELPPSRATRSGSSFASNEDAQDGRLLLIVLDDEQTSFTAGRTAIVKSIARRTVERLGPADVAGVITTSGRLGGQAEFTSDKSRLLEAIERFRPQGEHELPAIATPPPSLDVPNTKAERIESGRVRASMTGLTVATRALGTIQQRRKGVLLISQGFPATVEEIVRGARLSLAYEAMREFILMAQRSNVVVYTVDPCGLDSGIGCTRETRQNLRSIAEHTGGFAVVNTNAPEESIDRMLAENGSYYLLGYYSPAPPNDGKHHSITVKTRVPNVELRAREGYYALSKAARASTASPLEALNASPLQSPGLTMRVVAIPAPLAATPFAAVVVGIEVPTEVAVRAGRTQFAIAAIDDEGRTRARATFTTNFGGGARSSSAWTRTGSRIDVPPGRYQIRVAALGADATRGSVFTEVSVPRFDAELGVGGLSLGAPSAIPVTDADRLRGVLTLVPIATSEILRGTALAAQLPIRVSLKATSTPLTINTTLVRASGATLTLDRTTAASRDYSRPGGKVYRVNLPPALEAGAYRLIVEATLNPTQIVRDIEFSVLEGQQ